jgi:hypothetical protein
METEEEKKTQPCECDAESNQPRTTLSLVKRVVPQLMAVLIQEELSPAEAFASLELCKISLQEHMINAQVNLASQNVSQKKEEEEVSK